MGAPTNVFAKFMNIPLLGPVHLATIARRAGYDAGIINENILQRKVNSSELLETDILCLSCITATVNRGREIARQYRILRQGKGLPSRAIIGGIHASMLPEDPGPDFDQVVCGEAETILIDVLSGKKNAPVVHGTRLDNLDDIPVPDFSLIKNYEKISTWPVMTSRSCPHHCNFCSVTKMFGKEYRTQSTERVMDEVTSYKKKGWIFFVDDNFTAIPSRSHKLLDQMIKYRVNHLWTAQVRVDAAKDITLVRKMRAAGCRIVFIGLESINPGSLQKMKKHQNVDDINKALSIFQKEGIQVHGMFMLGNDPDTKEIFQATSSFCRKNALSYAQYSVLTPLPGTELYDDIVSQGRLLHKNWSLYDGLHVVFKPKQMSPEELQRGMIYCFKAFYSYSQAFAETLKSGFSLAKNYRSALRSFYPAFMKFAGRTLVHQWIRYNRAYLTYLSNIKS